MCLTPSHLYASVSPRFVSKSVARPSPPGSVEHVVGECHQSLLAIADVAAHDFLGVLRIAGEDGVDNIAVFGERVPDMSRSSSPTTWVRQQTR